MFNFFQNIHIDWLGKRKIFIAFSVFIMLAGLVSTIGRQYTPGGTDAFNLGVDFKGGTVVVAKFRTRPADDEMRTALHNAGVADPVIQSSTDKPDEVLIKIPLVENASSGETTDPANAGAVAQQVQAGRQTVKTALETFGPEAEGDATLATNPDAAFKISVPTLSVRSPDRSCVTRLLPLHFSDLSASCSSSHFDTTGRTRLELSSPFFTTC